MCHALAAMRELVPHTLRIRNVARVQRQLYKGKAVERGVGVRKLQHWQDLRAQFVANSLALLLHYIKNKSQWQTSRRLYSLSLSPAFCHAPSCCCCLCRQLLCKVIKMLNVNGAAREREGGEGKNCCCCFIFHIFTIRSKVWQQTLNWLRGQNCSTLLTIDVLCGVYTVESVTKINQYLYEC